MAASFQTEGTLESTPLPVLICRILDLKLSGMLYLESQGKKAWIYFADGFPAGVQTSLSQDFLGAVLREMGLIDDAAYNESLMGIAKTKQLQGEFLLEKGKIDAEQLERGLSYQLARKLTRLFSMISGTYRFAEDEDLPEPMKAIRVNPYALIYNGIKNHYKIDDLKRGLGVLVGKACRSSALFEERKELFSFSEEELADLAKLSEFRNPQEFVRSANSGTTLGMMLLFSLLSCGMLECGDPGQGKPLQQPKPQPAPEPKPQPAPEPKPQPAPKPDPAEPAHTKQPRPPPSAGKSRKADKNGAPSDLEKRVRAKFEQIQTADLWEVLEIEMGSDAEQVKQAYLQLAKFYHPDRIRGVQDETLVKSFHTITAKLNEAYAILIDPKSRSEYMGSTAAGSKGGGELDFQKALVFLKKKDYKQAAEAMNAALGKDTNNGDFKAFRVWIEYLRNPQGSEQERARKAKNALVPIAQENKQCFYPLKFLTMLFKLLEDDENYERALKAAYSRNERDVDISREMRLWKMRQEKEGKRGFFGLKPKK